MAAIAEIADIQKLFAGIFPGLMGIRLAVLEPDRVVAHMEVRQDLCTATDSSTKFIAGARLGSTVTGTCVALHRGRTTMVWQTAITNAEGKLCSVVTQTQLVLDPAP
jgi:1,4-dihydroxy-2-naphthoyl-CoA hydrolase